MKERRKEGRILDDSREVCEERKNENGVDDLCYYLCKN